eukprot:350494-Chlamydomonas_euryale.AAC.5
MHNRVRMCASKPAVTPTTRSCGAQASEHASSALPSPFSRYHCPLPPHPTPPHPTCVLSPTPPTGLACVLLHAAGAHRGRCLHGRDVPLGGVKTLDGSRKSVADSTRFVVHQVGCAGRPARRRRPQHAGHDGAGVAAVVVLRLC